MKRIIIFCLALIALVTPSEGAKAQSSQNDQKGEALSLRQALTIGLDNNFGIKIADLALQQASTLNTWGMAGGSPSINFTAAAELNDDFSNDAQDVTAQGSAKVDIQWLLFGGFNVKATKALLESDEDAAEGQQLLEVENTLHSIITSYYYVLLQQEMLKINETVMGISKDRLEQQKVSKAMGASGTYEYVQAESAYLTDKASFLKQEVALRDAVRALNLMLSLPVEKTWTLTEVVEIPEADYSLSQMNEKMMDDNRHLQNQYITLQAQKQSVVQSRSGLYPTIGAYASFTAANDDFSSSGRDRLIPAVGLSLSFNLFNGGKTRKAINVAELQVEIAETSTEQMKLELSNELSTQLDGYNVYREIVNLDNMQLKVVETLLHLSEERYENGTINSFDFREVQLSYMVSASSRLNSIYNLIVANSQLLRLTGGIIEYVN